MADCCNNTTGFDGQSPAYRRTLWIVIGINAIMFAVEMVTTRQPMRSACG